MILADTFEEIERLHNKNRKAINVNLKFIITVAILIGSFNANAQTSSTTKTRIAEIKKWYAEIQTIGLKNCKTKTYVKYFQLTPTEKYPTDQKIQDCQLNNLYQVTKCQFNYYEGGKEVIIYRKNSKVFFVLIKGVNLAYVYEERYYCNQDEKIIQQLDRTEEDGINSNNKENRTNLYKNIKLVLEYDFDEIERALD
jgi:hypothetical protein